MKKIFFIFIFLFINADDFNIKEYEKYKNPKKVYNELKQDEALEVYRSFEDENFKRLYKIYKEKNNLKESFKDRIDEYFPSWRWVGFGVIPEFGYFIDNKKVTYPIFDISSYIRLFRLKFAVHYFGAMNDDYVSINYQHLGYGMWWDMIKFNSSELGLKAMFSKSNILILKSALYYTYEFESGLLVNIDFGGLLKGINGDNSSAGGFLIFGLGYKLW